MWLNHSGSNGIQIYWEGYLEPLDLILAISDQPISLQSKTHSNSPKIE